MTNAAVRWVRTATTALHPIETSTALVLLTVLVATMATDLRPVALTVLLAALVFVQGRGSGPAALAAAVPIMIVLTWRASPLTPEPIPADCTHLFAPIVISRAIESGVVLAAVVGLVHRLGTTRSEIGLRWPAKGRISLSIASFAAVLVLAGLLGPAITATLYGQIRVTVPIQALGPAVVFAVSNSILEEVVYRGAGRAWLARSIGSKGAILALAVIFGLAHAGPGMTGPVLPLVIAMTGVGALAGWVTVRTRSLAVPISAHIAADITLYYVEACRVG